MKKLILLLGLIIISQMAFCADKTPFAKSLEDKLKAFNGLEIYIDDDIDKSVYDFGFDVDTLYDGVYKKLTKSNIYKKDAPGYIIINIDMVKSKDNCTYVLTTIDIYNTITFKGVDGKTYETYVRFYEFMDCNLVENLADNKEAKVSVINDTINYIDNITDKIIEAYKKSHTLK